MGPNEPDDILRGAFGDLFEGESTLPPEEVWQNVRAAVVVTEKKRRGFFFWLIPAVLLVGAGTALLFLYTAGEENTLRVLAHSHPSVTDPSTGNTADARQDLPAPAQVNPVPDTDRPLTAPAQATRFFAEPVSFVPVGPRSPIQPLSARALTVGVSVPALAAAGEEEEESDPSLPALPILPWLSPEPVTQRQAALTHTTEYFFPRWVVGLEVGLGTNKRMITGNFSETYNSNQLVTQAISLNNRCFALTGGYRFNRFVSVHTGISTGVNTYRSDWYLRMLTEQSGGSYVFQTSEGSVKMASEDVNGYFSESDTALFRMRLHYSSRYYSIPLSVKLSLPGTRLSGYVRLGGSYDLHTTGQMKASLKYGNFWSGWVDDTKTVKLENNDRTKLRSVQALIGFGVETHRDAPLQFFFEPQMSIPLTPVYNSGGLKVTSQYMQVRAGMTFFLPSHPTKRSICTSW